MVKEFMVEKLKSGLEKFGFKKSGVEKFGVEMFNDMAKEYVIFRSYGCDAISI